MDEIFIEEKKYVSSKRAAKMTGYAKDYIGQLCREGRVPARLIGRGWYVLEAAIADHRFGTSEGVGAFGNSESEKPAPQTPIASTWESPRYEASSEALLPSINRLKDEEQIQDSWKAWFDRFNHIESEAEPAVVEQQRDPESYERVENAVVAADPVEQRDPESDEREKISDEGTEAEEIDIPIHTVYKLPPEELLPRHVEVELPSNIVIRKKRGKGVMRTVQVTGVAFAMVVATIAVIGSGYLDKYILSSSQVRIIAGVALYNK